MILVLYGFIKFVWKKIFLFKFLFFIAVWEKFSNLLLNGFNNLRSWVQFESRIR